MSTGLILGLCAASSPLNLPFSGEQRQAGLVLTMCPAASLTFLRLQRHLVAFSQPLHAAHPFLLKGRSDPCPDT